MFVHELGHFTAAKLVKVHVQEFALGFGKAIWKRKWGDTVYRVNYLPFGGYVKLEGQDYGEATNSDAGNYALKPLWAKVFILVAGVVMNFITAAIFLAVFLALLNYTTTIGKQADYTFVGATNVTERIVPSGIQISEVVPGTAAEKSIKAGDLIYELNGAIVSAPSQLSEFIQQNRGATLPIKLARFHPGGRVELLAVEVSVPEGDAILGVHYNSESLTIPFSYYDISYPAFVTSGVAHSVNIFGYQIKVLGELIAKSLAEKSLAPVGEGVGSVLTVGVVISNLIDLGDFLSLLNLAALVSLSLAFMNILPIPGLDGGYVVIETLQSILGRKFDEKKLNFVTNVSVLALILLSVVILLKDTVQQGILSNMLNFINSVLGR